jgi:WD40 repeat protein
MFSTYLDFEVIIGVPGAAGYSVIVQGPGGDARGDLTLPTSDLTYQGLMDRLGRLDTDEEALTTLGQILFRALFKGSVQEVYVRSQGTLTEGQGLRITLNIAASEAAVAALPWEFLHDPDHGPLALLDAPIVRYLPHQSKIPILQTALPLKVLLTAAQTPPPVNVARELRVVETALAGLGEFVHVTVEPHLTISKLQRLLREEFHVWHFAGHGGFDSDGTTGRLAFEDATGDVEYVSAPQLGVLLNRSSVRLIVLDACQSAQLATQPLRSVAPVLIHAQVPAVIAMQQSITDEAARSFATEFYQALAEGFPIDACVTEGRKAVMSATGLGRADWGIPVAYTRAPDGVLFDVPPAPKPRCPYPGMVPFRAADAGFFYGRDDEIGQLLQRLRHQRLLFVIGPSGSGKSSLVRAGLLPRLSQSSLFPQDFWLVRELRPGARPLEALGKALGGDPTQPAQTIAALLDAHPAAQRLLLVIDQFEELFSVAERGEQSRFIGALKALRVVEGCAQLIMMRADFYPDLMTSDLWPIDASQRLEVAPLRGAALRQAIEQPAKDVGVRLEPGLIDRLLADAADEPGVLPLVQETMVLLWDAMPRRLLPIAVYTRLGGAGRSGLAVAIAMKADATMADLAPAAQAIARRTFVRLIQFGEGRADTRRQQPLAALRAAGDDPAQFEATLRHLTDNRLLTLRGEEGGADRKVDIAHEALIAGWPALQGWLTERRAAEQTRRRLEDKAAEWVRLGRGTGGLLDAAELPEAERWLAGPDAADLGYDEALPALVAASHHAIEAEARETEAARQRELDQARALAAEQKRRSTILLRSAIALVGLVVLAGVTTWLAVQQRQTAEKQRAETDRLRLVSIVQALAAQSPRQRAQFYQDEQSALLARQAYLFSQRGQGQSMDQIDGALRTALAPYFSHILHGHSKQVSSVAFSSDSQILASASWDGTVQLSHLGRPDAPPEQLASGESRMTSMAFSPDGQFLAVGDDAGNVRLWDISRPNSAPHIWRDRTGGITSVAFSPDGQMLAAASATEAIRLWNVRAPDASPHILSTGAGKARSVTFNPNGQTVVAGTDDGSVRLWDMRHPDAEPVDLPICGNDCGGQSQSDIGITSVAFSQDGEKLAAGVDDGSVRLWKLTAGAPSAPPVSLRRQTEMVTSVGFSPDGQTLASASWDRTVVLWDLHLPTISFIALGGFEGGITSVAFSPDGQMLAAGSEDQTARLWDLRRSSAAVAVLDDRPGASWSLAFAPDGQTLAAGSYAQTVRLWEVHHLEQPPHILGGRAGRVWSVAFNPHGQTLAAGNWDGTMWLWDYRRPDTEPVALHGAKGGITSVAFSSDGSTLAAGTDTGTVWLWDLRQPSATPIALSGTKRRVNSVAFSPDGQTLAAGSDDTIVWLWDLRQPGATPTKLSSHTQEVWSVAFSPDGSLLASGSDDNTVRLWDWHQPGMTSRILSGHVDGVTSVVFSPDSKTLASGSYDDTVRLWDLTASDPAANPLVLRGHQARITSVAFSSDGQTLASASADRTTRIWSVSTKALADLVCEKVWRNLRLGEWEQFVGPGIPYERTCPNLPPGDGAP